MKRTPLKRGGYIKRKGHLTTLWDVFRAKYAEECRDADGLILCQCDADCGIRSENPDLTHIRSKAEAPWLYFDKSNLRWQIRAHHIQEHLDNGIDRTVNPVIQLPHATNSRLRGTLRDNQGRPGVVTPKGWTQRV